LPSTSPNTNRVSGRIAAAKPAGSRGLTKVVWMPKRGRVWVKKGVGEEVVRAAVDRARRDDMAALAHQGGDREVEGGLAAGGADRPHPALEGSDPFLEHRDRGVGDAAVDVAGALEIEQGGRLVDVAEDIGRGLVDRHGACPSRRVWLLAGMQAEGVEAQEFGVGHGRASSVGQGQERA
jgi:hypothetical protein